MRLYLIAHIAILITFAAGCSEKPAAKVNGDRISKSALKWSLSQRVSQHAEAGADIKEQDLRDLVLDQLITQKLLYQGAREKGIVVDESELKAQISLAAQSLGDKGFEKKLKEASLSREEFAQMTKEALAADKFSTSLILENPVTEDDVKNFYKSSPQPFLTPESVNVRFIQTTTREQAEDIAKELGKGKNFDKLADKLQKENRATVQGYSWTNPDFFSPEIAVGLKDMKEGHFDGPFKSKEGYFIFRVKKREHSRAKTFEEARDEIRAMLADQGARAAVAHWLAEKKKNSDIDIYKQ